MASLREYEERLEQTKASNQITFAERDREIASLREKISDLMSTYDELMNRKTSLEFEINTYRRLLECEETRIKSGGITSSGSGSGASYSSSSYSSSSNSRGGAVSSGSSMIGGGSGVGGLISQTIVSSGSGGSGQAGGDPSLGGSRSSYTQRGSSTELSSETITKRMQVQRTSKGNLYGDY